jgi:iron complex transport system ATP-binding protein
MENQSSLVRLENVAIGYKSHVTKVVKSGITLEALPRELVAIIGENGVGKSTLLKTLGGFLPPLEGQLTIGEKSITEYQEKELAKLLSYVSTEQIRVPNLNVYDLVSLGRYPHTNWFGKLLTEDRLLIEEAIVAVGLQGFEDRLVNNLSDGERQKVMIARALAQDTPIIILDEPTAFLDLSNKFELVHILQQLARTKGKTILFSTHDLTTALAESDRMWLMLKDSIQQGSPEDLILNGSFNALFDQKQIDFDREKGDFKIRKTTNRFATVKGEGERLTWTTKALERNGILVAESTTVSAEILNIQIGINDWSVEHNSKKSQFTSLYSMCQYLRDLK